MSQGTGWIRQPARRFGATVLCASLAATTASGAVIHVDDDAEPGGDGKGWDTAYRWLHEALLTAEAGDEIRVAQGRYVPDPEGGDREVSFALVLNTMLRGGYAGIGAPDPDERDVDQYETILSGDLNGDDGPGFENNDENSWHVVLASGVGSGTEISGFTITAGNADGPEFPETGALGGGMLATSNVTISHCRFEANWANQAGAGLFIVNATGADVHDCAFVENVAWPDVQSLGGGASCVFANAATTFTDCVFRDNRAGLGAGFGTQAARPTFTGCLFEGNWADNGGAVATIDAEMRFNECIFRDNLATPGDGGALISILQEGGSPLVINSLFVGNQAFNGGAVANIAATPEFTNCTFSRNRADEKLGGVGGAIFNFAEGSPLLRGTILWGNTPEEISDGLDSSTRASFCDVRGGWAGPGNVDVDPMFRDQPGGDYRLAAGSPVIDAGDTLSYPPNVDIDLDGNPRFDDDPCTPDTGRPGVNRFPVDIGAYEYQVPCPTDLDCSGDVGFSDLVQVLEAWGSCGWCLEDIDGDGDVGIRDVVFVLSDWGPC